MHKSQIRLTEAIRDFKKSQQNAGDFGKLICAAGSCFKQGFSGLSGSEIMQAIADGTGETFETSLDGKPITFSPKETK